MTLNLGLGTHRVPRDSGLEGTPGGGTELCRGRGLWGFCFAEGVALKGVWALGVCHSTPSWIRCFGPVADKGLGHVRPGGLDPVWLPASQGLGALNGPSTGTSLGRNALCLGSRASLGPGDRFPSCCLGAPVGGRRVLLCAHLRVHVHACAL